ncbi:MAG: xanthine dehydrogenase family protein molybdopterin-binding subunit [Chloroflexi bacterium]|nr:xanthine dehydrogenase family protein molybdopterin-binding subunit [Chloroflexota bacterium]
MSESASKRTRTVGKGLPKSDARVKATGAALFAGDVRLGKRNPLCGKILRSLHAHASIVSIDTSEAAALKGVYAVVTGEAVTPARIGRFLRDRTVLARGKVRHIGEPVAAVAAIDEATAEEALSLIRVEYQPLPATFTPGESMTPDAPLIHEDLAGYEDAGPSNRNGNQRNLVTVERGDVEAAFAQAEIVLEGTFSTQAVSHAFIEPKSCLAEVGKDGKVTIWPANKGPFRSRAMISAGLGLPLSKIRIICPAIGGEFGGKGAPTIEPICVLLAIKTGRPVKITLNRHEELASSFVRHPATIRLKVAATRDGRLLGLDGEVVYNCGAYCDGVGGMAQHCATLQGSYNVPAVRLRGQSVITNSIPAGHVRGPGVPQVLFAIESLMDELARRTGLDPFEVRRLNALKEGDPAPGGRKGSMARTGLSETIEQIAEYVGQNMRKSTAKQGLGVACGSLHTAVGIPPNDTKCILKLNDDGSAVLLTGMADIGCAQHMVLSQMVGEVLGLEAHEVGVVGGDSEVTPYDTGPGGSRGTTRVGHAAIFAAQDVRRQLLALAASRLEANADDLEIENKRVYVKGSPDRALSFAALVQSALASPAGVIVGTGAVERAEWQSEHARYEKLSSEAIFCTHAALVEVDTETGKVSVLKYAVAQDLGFALNPLSAEGQLHGAVAFGLGYALSEEIIVKEGRVANPHFVDYHVPAADICPDVKTIIVEQPTAIGPFGARGLGEAPVGAVAPAIANAVYDAVGVRIRDLPLTPEKVLKALKEKEKEDRGQIA